MNCCRFIFPINFESIQNTWLNFLNSIFNNWWFNEQPFFPSPNYYTFNKYIFALFCYLLKSVLVKYWSSLKAHGFYAMCNIYNSGKMHFPKGFNETILLWGKLKVFNVNSCIYVKAIKKWYCFQSSKDSEFPKNLFEQSPWEFVAEILSNYFWLWHFNCLNLRKGLSSKSLLRPIDLHKNKVANKIICYIGWKYWIGITNHRLISTEGVLIFGFSRWYFGEFIPWE